MRGIFSQKTQIRKEIFTEIARFAYEGGGSEQLEELPYKIIPGEIATYRDSIFLERAIVSERLRVAMGMSLRTMTEHAPTSKGVNESMIEEKYYEPPLINIIKFACHVCPEKRVFITDGCQGCLEHPCKEVCPKEAISIVKGKSVIDQDKCVSCGMCLVNCPFSAIVDKGQIYQTIKAIQSDTPVYAIVAPAIAGQFGPEMTETRIRSAFKALGFTDVAEVAVGADLCTIEEAHDFMKEVPEKLPFMATSCCPAWAMMAKKSFPDLSDNISMALTPMVLTARLIKKKHPDCKIAFIGLCAAKKLEASRKSVKSYVDFVLTFEEVAGMFNAKEIFFADLPEDKTLREASGDGRGFAVSGGVAKAVVNYIKKLDPNRDVKVVNAEGLDNCKKMLKLAKAGKYNGYLLEGMACPGGCIAGAGTLRPINKAAQALAESQKLADFAQAADTTYADWIPDLEQFEKSNNHSC